MKKIFISSAYIYPICPLNINHARMFIVGDIIARHAKENGVEVFFPIAAHYSGNTAHHFSDVFEKMFSGEILSEEERKIVALYKDTYKVPVSILKSFIQPLNILNFYNQEALWELKSLGVAGNYEYFYTTKDKDFAIFINVIINRYRKHDLTINNKKGEFALNYDDDSWREKMLELTNKIEFIQGFHKNNVISASKNIRSDWGLLREDGYGVVYNEKWIVDPMFDSELFTVFDLYIRFKKQYQDNFSGSKIFFEELFDVLEKKITSGNKLIQAIVRWLPCDVFICEEHLKNWVVKKMFAECLLLSEQYQTKKYFMLGMGLLNKKRMSASRGNAILARDLINGYGGVKARLIILLSGGHPSKTYKYDKASLDYADKLLGAFPNYYTLLVALVKGEVQSGDFQKEMMLPENLFDGVEENIQKGYYRQAIIDLLSTLPAKYPTPTKEMASRLLADYEKYLNILLPGILEGFQDNKSLSINKS